MTATIGWIITSLVLVLVVGKRVYHKQVIGDLREQMLWLDYWYQQMKRDRDRYMTELLRLRRFHRRMSALIEMTKKRKNDDPET
jgi:hypothetical protein